MIPQTKDGMFYTGMQFLPTSSLTQDQLNRIAVHLLRRFFHNADGNMPEIKFEDINSMLSLTQFIIDLDVFLSEEAFKDIPDDLKSLFMVKKRDGKDYRYGHKPKWV